MEIDIQELYVYPGVEPDDDLASRLEGDLIDLEPYSVTRWCLICRSNPCAGMTARGCVPNVAPTSTTILTTVMAASRPSMGCAARP